MSSFAGNERDKKMTKWIFWQHKYDIVFFKQLLVIKARGKFSFAFTSQRVFNWRAVCVPLLYKRRQTCFISMHLRRHQVLFLQIFCQLSFAKNWKVQSIILNLNDNRWKSKKRDCWGCNLPVYKSIHLAWKLFSVLHGYQRISRSGCCGIGKLMQLTRTEILSRTALPRVGESKVTFNCASLVWVGNWFLSHPMIR